MRRSVHCSLIVLIHIGLITVTTMALIIVPSSCLTCVGWHGSTIMWCTLTMWGYKAIIRRVSRLLIPIPIRWITLSILRPIIRSISHHIRCPMRQSISRDTCSGSRNIRPESSNMTSRSMNMTSWNNGWYLNLRHNWSSNSSTDMTRSNILARRTTWMRWRVNIRRTRDRGRRDLWNYVHVVPYSHSSWIWYPNRITNPRPMKNMWCNFHRRVEGAMWLVLPNLSAW